MLTTATRMFVIASLTVLVLVPASTVKALTISSTQAGAPDPVFFDRFEGATGDINGRTPDIGNTWIRTLSGAGSTDIETPNAFEGSNYLSVERAGGGGSATARGRFAGFEHTTGTITAEFMLRLESGATAPDEFAHAAFHNSGGPGYIAGIFIGNGSTGELDINLTRDLDNSRTLNNMNEIGNTGADFPNDGDWHRVLLQYTRETGTIGVSVDGGNLLTFNDAPGRNIDEFRLFATSKGDAHYDALIPEPTSALLALLGLIGLGLVGGGRVVRTNTV